MTAEALELRELVAGPGVYPGLPEDVYHSDPIPGGSLSSTGARMLNPPKAPAAFDYWREHGQPPKRVWDFGHVAHREVLGVGAEVRVLDFRDRRTDAYKAAEAEARADGAVPILAKDMPTVRAMADQIRRHKLAASLLRPDLGSAELSMFWVHERTGVMCRGRIDFLRRRASGLLLNVDYKTCDDASDEACEKAVYSYGLHQQMPWYEAGVKATGLGDDVDSLLIFQEKKPPYLVNVIQLDHDARRTGHNRNGQALSIYAQCTKSGRWPGYGDGVNPTLIGLPRWALTREGM